MTQQMKAIGNQENTPVEDSAQAEEELEERNANLDVQENATTNAT